MRKNIKLRSPIEVGEQVLVLASHLKKKDSPGKFWRSKVDNKSYFHKSETFLITNRQKIEGKVPLHRQREVFFRIFVWIQTKTCYRDPNKRRFYNAKVEKKRWRCYFWLFFFFQNRWFFSTKTNKKIIEPNRDELTIGEKEISHKKSKWIFFDGWRNQDKKTYFKAIEQVNLFQELNFFK